MVEKIILKNTIMQKNTFLIPALIIALGLAAMGWFLRSGITHFKDSERMVSVKGLSEKEVKADKVIWPIMFKESGNDLQNIYSKVESSNNTIISFLLSKGISEADLTISPLDIVDMDAVQYKSDVKYRYIITSVITVSTENVDLVRQLMVSQDELLKKGIAVTSGDYRYSIQYFYTKLNEIKPEMIEDATKNARQSAEKFAKDSESRLGKIKYANQGQFTITDRDANTPYIKNVRVVTTIEYYLK